MRRFLVPLMIVGVLLLPSGIALATPPTASSGTYEDWLVEITSIRYADGNIILTEKKEGQLSGTAEGRITETTDIVVGKRVATFHVIQICDPCVVGGRSGTYVARVDGTSEDGHDRGHWVYLSGTGELTNLHGHGTIEGSSWPDGSTSGTYSGEYHFDSKP